MAKSQDNGIKSGFKIFATKRLIIGVILAVAALWLLGSLMGMVEKTESKPSTAASLSQPEPGGHGTAVGEAETTAHTPAGSEGTHPESAAPGGSHSTQPAAGAHPAPATEHPHTLPETGREQKPAAHPAPQKPAEETGHAKPAATAPTTEAVSRPEKGVQFVESVIQPMEYELTERWWGWRPNDLIEFTDNVNNFQRGVLEVTRRAVVVLMERLSRTGSTDALNDHLNNAVNWFMIEETRYWFPSAETKYKECLEEIRVYQRQLARGQATFFTRADNLIPLLASFADLLGSCEENLVKHTEKDGSEVSFFKADDYFYYAQGVASSMATVLKAIHEDFIITLETRHGTGSLHHAIESCQLAAELSPLIITDSKLDGILANHRANMAAPISHARFFLEVLVKTLST